MPPVPELLPFNSPSLSEQLRCRTNQLRSKIIRANYKSQFARTAPELTDLRHAIAHLVDEMDDEILSNAFQKAVPFTTYESYSPYIAKLFEEPCRASAIVDLLAPGLPDFVAKSTSTSGGVPKILPRYNILDKIRPLDAKSRFISGPHQRRTKAYIYCLTLDRKEVKDEDGCHVKTIYLGSDAIAAIRQFLHLDPEEDEEKMATFLLDHSAPYAAGFINKWRPFLLIHALFALGNRFLESISMAFIPTFVDMIRQVDMEFDTLVDCIANGTIPDLDGLSEVRHYLELNISPDPERADELRSLGRPTSAPGWCGRVWPSLRSLSAISSGFFASSVPLARWFLGPNVVLLTHGYRCTEARIGLPHSSLELNLFKLEGSDIIEFLDINKTDSISSLAQPWEVEVGSRYEVVVTTVNGLWRYRLGDVVEISGFDPMDGAPVFQFIARRNAVLRLSGFMVTEEELRGAMLFLASTVANWTATIDHRFVIPTIGFFVELASDQVSESDLAHAPDRVLAELSRNNELIASSVPGGRFRRPTIRVVRSGTFNAFIQLKLDEGGDKLGQMKVPVVLPKAAYVTWFSDRVVSEFGAES